MKQHIKELHDKVMENAMEVSRMAEESVKEVRNNNPDALLDGMKKAVKMAEESTKTTLIPLGDAMVAEGFEPFGVSAYVRALNRIATEKAKDHIRKKYGRG